MPEWTEQGLVLPTNGARVERENLERLAPLKVSRSESAPGRASMPWESPAAGDSRQVPLRS